MAYGRIPSLTAARSQIHRHRRRGVTFVEVICAVAMLALAAAAMMSAGGAVMNGQVRGVKRLGAAEIANRLMLMYLDDEESLPNQSAPIEYGNETYRWSKSVSPVTISGAMPQDTMRASGALSLDRMRAVTFTVWETDERRGRISNAEGSPSFSLTRIVDPIFGQLRNPDTRERIMSDPVLRQRFIDMITGRGTPAPRAPERKPTANPDPKTGGKP